MKSQGIRRDTNATSPTIAFVPESRVGAWFLDTDTWETYVLRPAAAALAEMVPNELRSGCTILDAGCGAGRAFAVLAELFSPDIIHAVEIEPKLAARARVRSKGLACRVDVSEGDVGRLGFADASIDLVFCHQVLHHATDQERVLREIYRVLKPRGILILSESCKSFIETVPVRVLFRHPRAAQRTATGYIDLLSSVGFEVDTGCVRTSSPFWSVPLRTLLILAVGSAPRVTEPRLVTATAIRPN